MYNAGYRTRSIMDGLDPRMSKKESPPPLGQSTINAYQREKPMGNTLSFDNLTGTMGGGRGYMGRNDYMTPGSSSYMRNSRPLDGKPNYLSTNVNDDNLYHERMQKNLNSWRYKSGNPAYGNSSRWGGSGAMRGLYHNAHQIMSDGIQDGDRDRLNDIWSDMSGTVRRNGGANFNFNDLF